MQKPVSLAERKNQAISIIGMGYVGLATALSFAKAGYLVRGVEIDKEKLSLIASGDSPIHEVGIDSLLRTCIKKGTFSVKSNIAEAVSDTSITFVTVGTPSKPDGNIDLTFVEAAILEIGRALGKKNDYHLVVIKSTVVPGTTSGSLLPILKGSSGKAYPDDFGLCFNPEFLREGTAIEDMMHPDALVIGSEDENSSKTLITFYKDFYGKLPYTLVSATSNAELVKYAINTFRATQLSFLNSLANLCERIPSADVAEVTKGLSAVTKIDRRYLRAGFGFGGSCWPKDLRALIALSRKQRLEPKLLLSVLEFNKEQPQRAIEISRKLLGDLSGRKVSVLGLTFKAGTDDVRESVALSIVSSFLASGAKVKVYDPSGMQNAARILQESVDYAETALSCISGTECCVVATEWKEFASIPPSSFKELMQNPIVIDGRCLLDPKKFESTGVELYQLGTFHPERNIPEIQIESSHKAR